MWCACNHFAVPRPFVTYLRVYEPLSAFDEVIGDRIRRSIDAAPLPRALVGQRERELWLRSQLASPTRLLPGDGPDGDPPPTAPREVLVLAPEELPTGGESTETGGPRDEPMVCPLDLRPRAATALVSFLATASGPLIDEALIQPQGMVRSRASAVMAELASGAVHSISATWTVPLPWFCLVDPDARHVVLAPRDDPERSVSWQVGMADARHRTARSYDVVSKAIGEEGPASILRDTGRWLEHFDPASVVELDYGGLVQLLDDEALLADTSAADVHAIVDALEMGDAERVAERYELLRDFWGELAVRERFG